MLYYFIISGLILWVWVSYREHETNNGISLLDILFHLVSSMVMGWIILPIALLALLDTIKIKIK